MARANTPETMSVNHHYFQSPYNVMLRTINIDQMPLQYIVDAEDKIAVKKWVDDTIGPGYTPEQYAWDESYSKVIKNTKKGKFWLKLNKFSGHNSIVENGKILKPKNIYIPERDERDGRWWLDYIEPMWFSEEIVEDEPIDYKFHIHRGHIAFCQVLSDRHTGNVKEIAVDVDGNKLNWNIDREFMPDIPFIYPEHWVEMKEIAVALGSHFHHVRVDLYSTPNGVRFGELTVLPGRGLLQNIEGGWHAWMICDAIDDHIRGIPEGQKR